MEKSDIKELRKAVKAKDPAVDWVYGIYVDSENHPICEDLIRLSEMDEAEMFRHVNMFVRVLSPKIGQDSFPVALSRQMEDLLNLRSIDHPDLTDFEGFRDRLLTEYAHTDPYYATLSRIVYDVPSMTKDRRKLDDSEAVYEALIFTVSKASLSKPVLGLDEDHVAELGRRWQIGNPASGFVYPAFDERAEDRNEVLVHSKSPDLEDFINALFEVERAEVPLGVKEQKSIFSELLGAMDVDLPTCAAISENILQKASEEDAGLSLEKNTVKKIAEAAGAKTEEFDEIYDETVGETPLAYAAIAEPYVTVRTDAATLKVPSDKSQLIETRVIDGREYILIPADGTVTVNGTAVSASSGGENGTS